MTLLHLLYGSPEMIELPVARSDIFVKLHQCLFGYDDGHRLLSTSQTLPNAVASLLLLQSDLVPGLSANRPNGYWTGIPIPAGKLYALMRTWTAPEMSRPGCVWTHVVLITLADMARFPDLAVLESLFVRPCVSAGYTAYATPLTVNPLGAAASDPSLISRKSALRVLRALYSAGSPDIPMHDGEPIDDAIFAVWSQQWPRLRRAFSFRTAGQAADRSDKPSFNLRVVREPQSIVSRRQLNDSSIPRDWEQAAIDDLLASEQSPFRRFLWRYGADVRRGRERYRFLAELYLATQLSVFDQATLTRSLDRIADALPNADDGQLLKEDLLSCGASLYSLLPAADPIEILSYLASHTHLTAFPQPPETLFEAVHTLWPTRAPEILTIAEQSAGNSSAIAEQLVSCLSTVADSASFLVMSREHPIIRERLIRANPALLDSPELVTMAPHELSQYLVLIPESGELAVRVLDRLLDSDSRDTAALFAERFLGITQDRVFDALILEFCGIGRSVPRVWPDAVRQRSPDLVSHMLNRATTTTGLGALAGWLGLDVRAGLKASPPEWASALLRVRDDLRGQQRQKLLAYLLAVALARPGSGCEPLFEMAFESVHTAVGSSTLPDEALDALAPFLPDLFWWQQWDTCLRLRFAVVGAYVDAELDPQSFRRLTSESILFSKLVSIASDTKRGQRFVRGTTSRSS